MARNISASTTRIGVHQRRESVRAWRPSGPPITSLPRRTTGRRRARGRRRRSLGHDGSAVLPGAGDLVARRRRRLPRRRVGGLGVGVGRSSASRSVSAWSSGSRSVSASGRCRRRASGSWSASGSTVSPTSPAAGTSSTFLPSQRRGHERRPDPRRVLAAEERRQPADAVEVGPAGALVEVDRRAQLRGVADEPGGGRGVRPQRGGAGLAGRRSAERSAPRCRCRCCTTCCKRVAHVGHDVLVEDACRLRRCLVTRAAVGALHLVARCTMPAAALRRDRA